MICQVRRFVFLEVYVTYSDYTYVDTYLITLRMSFIFYIVTKTRKKHQKITFKIIINYT